MIDFSLFLVERRDDNGIVNCCTLYEHEYSYRYLSEYGIHFSSDESTTVEEAQQDASIPIPTAKPERGFYLPVLTDIRLIVPVI